MQKDAIPFSMRPVTWVHFHVSFLMLFVGERALYCLKDDGTVRFMKKLEYNPSCFLPYDSGTASYHNAFDFIPVNDLRASNQCP